jgi:hypothetical protein
MSNIFSVITSWSTTNPLVGQKIDQAVQQEIQTRWQSKRYRRLIYYFFEKEITADTYEQLQSRYTTPSLLLTDPEVQALVARSALAMSNHNQHWDVWFTLTPLLNDYLLWQGRFTYDVWDSDVLFAQEVVQLLESGHGPSSIDSSVTSSSDILLVLRRFRSDLQLVTALVQGQYGYRSLVQACWEHLAYFGVMPLLFSFLDKSRSSESFLYFLEEDTHILLKQLLVPQYEVVCQYIDLVEPYGSVDLDHSPYATIFARLGMRWSQRSRWIKVLTSVLIIIISSSLWWRSLIILPIIRWILQGAGSASDYLILLKQVFSQWYHHYTSQHESYIALYETMIDPDQSTKDTLHSEQLMNHRFDIVPFGGHELMRDVTLSTQKLLDLYAQVIADPQSIWLFSKELSQTQASLDRWRDHFCPLWIIKNTQQKEQSYYRFVSLVAAARERGLPIDEQIHLQTYDAIEEMIGYKTSQFLAWTNFRTLIDGSVVAMSSGILWWLGAYLRNRSSFGSSVFAASSTWVATSHVSYHLDTILSKKFTSMLSATDIDRITTLLHQHTTQDTIRDTFVHTFGYQQWNTINASLMDTRWRLTDTHGQSELFTKAFQRSLPLGSHDPQWNHLLSFLDRIYGYDNLSQYQELIHQSRLPTTLQSLHDGSMTIDQFAQLPQAQREIVTQAMFTAVQKEDIFWLMMDVDVPVVDTMTGLVSSWVIHNPSLSGWVLSPDSVSWSHISISSLESWYRSFWSWIDRKNYSYGISPSWSGHISSGLSLWTSFKESLQWTSSWVDFWSLVSSLTWWGHNITQFFHNGRSLFSDKIHGLISSSSTTPSSGSLSIWSWTLPSLTGQLSSWSIVSSSWLSKIHSFHLSTFTLPFHRSSKKSPLS